MLYCLLLILCRIASFHRMDINVYYYCVLYVASCTVHRVCCDCVVDFSEDYIVFIYIIVLHYCSACCSACTTVHCMIMNYSIVYVPAGEHFYQLIQLIHCRNSADFIFYLRTAWHRVNLREAVEMHHGVRDRDLDGEEESLKRHVYD